MAKRMPKTIAPAGPTWVMAMDCRQAGFRNSMIQITEMAEAAAIAYCLREFCGNTQRKQIVEMIRMENEIDTARPWNNNAAETHRVSSE